MRQSLTRILAIVASLAMVGAAAAPTNPAKGAMGFRYLDSNHKPCATGSVGCEIFAEGTITEATPQNFLALLAQYKIERASSQERVIALSSEGGDVAAAMTLGKHIREYGFTARLHEARGSRQVCQGDQDYEALIDLKAPPASRCVRILWEEIPSKCLSACIFAFVGGVDRQLWGTSRAIDVDGRLLTNFRSNDLVLQDQIGFHPIRPSNSPSGTDAVGGYLMDMGAVWGQREMARATEYFDAMGVSRDVLAFFTRSQAGAAAGGFYYPLFSELQRVGVLENPSLVGPRLDVIQGGSKVGLALSWMRNLLTNGKTQISLFCSDRMGGSDHLYLSLSNIDAPVSGHRSDDLIPLTRMRYPPARQSFQANAVFFNPYGVAMGWKRWTVTVKNDVGVSVTRGQAMPYVEPTDPPTVEMRQATSIGTAFFTTDQGTADGSRPAEHFVAGLASSEVDRLLSGTYMTIAYKDDGGMAVAIDDDFRLKVKAVKQNCLP